MVSHPRASLGARALQPLGAPVSLWVRADPAGHPLAVRKARWSEPRAVVRVQDRWRIDDEWWRDHPIARFYYTVLLDDGTLLTLYHDLIANTWFEQRDQGSKSGVRCEKPVSGLPTPDQRLPSCTELHLHTCYSFLEGASPPEDLVARAAQLGYEALAITDRDGLHGAMEFAQACVAANLRPITGVELTLRHGFHEIDSGPVHLTLLAENSRGYANLCRLITEAHRSSPRSAVALDPAFLEGHTEGVIALSGCRSSEVTRLVEAGRLNDASKAARLLAERFGWGNTFVELQHNLVHGDTRRVAGLAELAARLGLGIVATGDVHYHDRTLHRLQDALVAVKHHTTLEASHRLRRPNSEFFLRSPQEVAALFAEYPEAIANTALISERCRDFNLADRDKLGYEFPDFTRKTDEQQASADEVLANYCWARFDQRYPPGRTDPALVKKAHRQLVDELKLVAKHRLGGFFLIYRDIQELAAEVAREVRGAGAVRGEAGLPPGRGRGSSVSSIICYLTGLSHVDPVKNRLFFRRFLNEDMQTVPDIDLDFARDIREQLILRMYEHYGHDHVALVCSFATYKLRSAVRDVGKVLGLPPAAIDKLARLSEGGHASSVRLELERLPEFQGQAEGPLWECLADLAEQMDGLPRHVSQHVGGMIVSSRPLIEMVPVQPAAMEGRFICQWDKDSCDDARFIKIDFLALGMLSLVEDCLELIWENRGEKVDLGAISYQDPAVYKTICKGDTVGLFQIESRAQIQMLPRTQPRNLDDLAVQVAIVRPGPIVGGAVNPYVRRREAQRQNPCYRARADHPLLDDLLRDTLGVIIYQDQVLEVAMTIGVFTAGQADQFRRTISRRRSRAAMEKFRALFLSGARAKGVAAEVAESIFEKLLAFSGFGFPKSHAYAFAVLAYQSAWLRLYYPAEYHAALFNSQPMGFYPPHALVGDVKRHGLSIMRVAINRSRVRCTPGDGYILLGLTTVRGLGEDVARAIIAEREANGPYRSLPDLLRRTGLSYAIAENLIVIGALGAFGLSRRELLWQLGLLVPQSWGQRPTPNFEQLRTRERGRRARQQWQLALALPIDQDMVHLKDMDEWERMAADYGVLRLSPNSHPLGLLHKHLSSDILTSACLKAAVDGTSARTAGLVVCRQRPETAKGFIFLLLEDETGMTNVVIGPDLYDSERSVIRGQPYLCIEGVVQLRSGTLNLLATRVAPLDTVPGLLQYRLPSRQPYSGHRGEPNQADAVQSARPAHSSFSSPRALGLVTPTSHDFF
ncbi:MAG: error-prone DNA polymerase [Actinobacteria bacterium]|nr:error-prone DNA polymerase [Actinomycetota bacterium]